MEIKKLIASIINIFKSESSGNQVAVESDVAFESDVARPPERPVLFWGITVGWLILLCMILIYGYINWEVLIFTGQKWTLITKGQIACLAAGFWFIKSIEVLAADELSAVLLYGLTTIKVARGPKILPAGIFQLERFSGKVEETQFPDEPEFIQKSDDKVQLEEVEIIDTNGNVFKRKKVRPIRITSAAPSDDDVAKGGILSTQMTLEFTYWVRWIIVDPFDLIVNAGDAESVIKQMRDVGESSLNNYVTKKTPAQLIQGSKELEEALKTAIAESVIKWGVKVVSVGMTAIDLNHEVASELRNITTAKAKAEQTRINADANAYLLEQTGKGEGAATAAKLAGEGRGYKEAGELIGVEPREVLAAQVARDTIGQGDLILGTEGIVQAIGLGKKILGKE